MHVEGGVASPAYVGEYLIYLTLPSFLPLGLPYDMHQYSIVRLTWKTFSMAQPSHPKSEMRSDRRIQSEKRKLPSRGLRGVLRAFLRLCAPPCSAHFLANLEAAHAVLAPWLLYPQALVRGRGRGRRGKGACRNGRVCSRLDHDPPFSSSSSLLGAAPWPRALRVFSRENEENAPEPCEWRA